MFFGETSSTLEDADGAADSGGDVDGDVDVDLTICGAQSGLVIFSSTMMTVSTKASIFDAVEGAEAIAIVALVFSHSMPRRD